MVVIETIGIIYSLQKLCVPARGDRMCKGPEAGTAWHV